MKKLILLLCMFKGCIAFGQSDNDTTYYPIPYAVEYWVSGSRTLHYHLRNGKDSIVEQYNPNQQEWRYSGDHIIQIDGNVHDSDIIPTIYVEPDKYDTIPVIMLVSDTSSDRPSWAAIAFYIKGYEVRQRIPPGWSIGDIQHDAYYEHKEYLDEYKQPLDKNIVVWLTK